VLLSYKFRLLTTKAQDSALSEMLGAFCQLYNAALEHRINAYAKGVSIKCYDQIVTLPQIRKELPHIGRWSASAEQQVLRRLDKAYSAFFGRIKRGEKKAGFPRFRSRDRYHAADFRVGDGLTLRKSGRLGIVGVETEIKVKWHRPLLSVPKSAILTRQAGKWHIVFHLEVAAVERASPDSIGLDLGLTALAALSNGAFVERPNFTKSHAKALRRRQRALARCKRGSKNRRKRKLSVTKLQAHIGNARRDYLHKESRKLVNRFGRIGIEDLNIKGLASGMLAKSVHDASWAQLTAMLTYKAESAGVELVKVDPRGTSQTCPECGTIAKKTLAERTHRCDCGCTLDRDVAAAMVVHFRAFGFWPGSGLGTLSERVAA
jgi:putative transposase